MKQTAVEWLINELHKKEQGLIEVSYNHLFDQAKETEKQQMNDVYDCRDLRKDVSYDGGDNFENVPMYEYFEDYYNSTFKDK